MRFVFGAKVAGGAPESGLELQSPKATRRPSVPSRTWPGATNAGARLIVPNTFLFGMSDFDNTVYHGSLVQGIS